MKHKSHSIVPHQLRIKPSITPGFTVWVHLARPAAAREVHLFRAGLDRYLERQALVRSMNPLHMLVWAPDRDATAEDQVGLLSWLISDGRAIGAEIGALQRHVGIPNGRDRTQHLLAMFNDQSLLAAAFLYKAGRLKAQQVIDMIGGFRPPVTLH